MKAVFCYLVGVTASAPPLVGYKLIPGLSDEFDGPELDGEKWATDPQQLGWKGRQPGLFDPANVVVADGMLQLWARAARRNASWPEGYDNYTTAAVHSVQRVRKGYFEIRWKSGSSGISSSWWFHQSTGDTWTEIDVFETTGVTNPFGAHANSSQLPSHVHVFQLPNVSAAGLPERCGCKENKPGVAPCSIGASYSLPDGRKWADDFRIAGLNWTETGVEILLDGVVVSRIESDCLPQEIGMDFDRETMPGWMVLPDPETLPDRPFLVDYVRSYERV